MIDRVAYVSMHTSPLLQPGVGDAGGMNVYVDGLARTMAARGVAVDVYTRREDPHLPAVVDVAERYRVVRVDAGPATALPIRSQAIFVAEFAADMIGWIERLEAHPDLLHSHYWLSGWAGLAVKRRLGVPLANSFHTLGHVKDLQKRDDEPPESLLRIAAEAEVIDESDCVIASTPDEAADLLEHYGADPGRLCTSPPGVDHSVFCPGDKDEARRVVGLEGDPLLLYVGRIQPLKGVDVAIEAFSIVKEQHPGARLLVVGGPSGAQGVDEMERLEKAAADIGGVEFHEPMAHDDLADLYRAADVVLVPSRSESFGLVAAEAQSCGVPVVAARTGGLPHVVADGVGGVLVDGWDPEDHAAAVLSILEDPERLAALRSGAVESSARFSWQATADRFLELYSGVLERVGS